MEIQKTKKRLPGVFLKHHKNTNTSKTARMSLPEKVKILTLQHIGQPCEPLVKKGDLVKLGQKIGENKEKLSAPIHSSVSGVVTAIEDVTVYSGMTVPSIVIEPDGLQTIDESVKPPVINSKEDFLNAIYESGMVGLGGAGFPTHAKLTLPKDDKVDTIIINGAECEPYITSDDREFIDNANYVIDGILQVQKYLGIKNAYIGIEDNKKEALKLMQKASEGTNIHLVSLPSKYPQGAEKVLIYTVTGRVVKEGKLPSSVGVVVLNVTTISKLGRYFKTGMPLTAKRLTVDGDCISKPQNVRVPIGTPIQDVIDFCGGLTKEPKKVICGGPMMGVAITDINTPIIKNNNAILAFSEDIAVLPETTACIRCGKCNRVCPAKLMPRSLEIAYDTEDTEMLEEYSAKLCINCGCCSYICPAKRHLAQKIQLAIAMLRKSK